MKPEMFSNERASIRENQEAKSMALFSHTVQVRQTWSLQTLKLKATNINCRSLLKRIVDCGVFVPMFVMQYRMVKPVSDFINLLNLQIKLHLEMCLGMTS